MAETTTPIPQSATTTPPTTVPSKSKSHSQTRELASLTIKSPPFSYIHLTTSPFSGPASTTLDPLTIRAYCTSALRQFLGDTGFAMPIDILAVQDSSVWVRVPRPDLAAFCAAMTAYGGMARGSGNGGGMMVLRVKACGDWLGSLLGRVEEGVWAS